MQRTLQLALGAGMLAVALAAPAQKPSAYPAKGQSAQQQSKDDGECGAWAKQNTGVDPAKPPPQTAAAAPPPQGQRVKGAAAGAAIGAIGGNDVGDAAVKGAVVGGVAKRNQARGQQQQAAAQQQQAAATQQQDMGKYWQAYKSCMTGRGYTIS
jgi:hypothetical protein